jgi:hypothetical protein
MYNVLIIDAHTSRVVMNSTNFNTYQEASNFMLELQKSIVDARFSLCVNYSSSQNMDYGFLSYYFYLNSLFYHYNPYTFSYPPQYPIYYNYSYPYSNQYQTDPLDIDTNPEPSLYETNPEPSLYDTNPEPSLLNNNREMYTINDVEPWDFRNVTPNNIYDNVCYNFDYNNTNNNNYSTEPYKCDYGAYKPDNIENNNNVSLTINDNENINENSEDEIIRNFDIISPNKEPVYDTVEMIDPETEGTPNDNVNDNVNDNNNVNTNGWDFVGDFDGLEILKIGRRFLISCPENHKDYGKRFFHNGKWDVSYNGWCFNMEHYQELIENGAIPSEEVRNMYFLDMCFEYYGRDKLLLQCYDTHPYYKQQEYYGGEWNFQADGWLFDKDQRQYLEHFGAVYECNEFSKLDNCRIITESYCNRLLYIIKPDKFNKYYGLKILDVSNLTLVWDDYYQGWIIYHDSRELMNHTEKENIRFFEQYGAMCCHN